MKSHRLARVAEAIRETASETILYDMHDPRVKFVTVTRAEVSGDLQHAKVFVSIMGTEKEQELTLKGLRHATGFIQSRLAKRLQTRFTPLLTIVLDQGVKRSIELARILHEELGTPSGGDAAAGGPAGDAAGADTDEAPERAGSADGAAEEERKDS